MQSWFAEQIGTPTLAQRLAWPVIDRGENLLLVSPTGSGKTLAAMGPILGRLLSLPAGAIYCLYIVPLKALGRDIRHNLRTYVKAIQPGDEPQVRVGWRTGDTSWKVRRQIWHSPPQVLVTTPESLAVLLAHREAGSLLRELRWVIVDEVHSLTGGKRGADLSLSLERLGASGSGVQRIGLSASCTPVETVARFLAGSGRDCTIAEAADTSTLQLQLELLSPVEQQPFLGRLLDRIDPEVQSNRTTLIFANVRSLAERLTWKLRQRYPVWSEQIAVHHSSLSARLRRIVERQLKAEMLRIVVSSTSLELGIDMDAVDGVILVHPPGGAAKLLQRAGRSGHRPGQPRRALVLTADAAELLEAGVTISSCQSHQLEPVAVSEFPLDVLCQHLLGLAIQGWCSPETAFELTRRAYPLAGLARHDFDSCLSYLSGRDDNGREWLPSRLVWASGEFTIADERTARLVRRNLGTILTEENRRVRQEQVDGKASSHSSVIGEVEDAFADRLQPGDRFVLEGRCWEYQRIERNALVVEEVHGRPRVPRWTGTGWPLPAELARRLYLFRVRAAEALRDGSPHLADLLMAEWGLVGPASAELIEFFHMQETSSAIPDLTACLIECVQTEAGSQFFLHNPMNCAGNDALARLIVRRLSRDRGIRALATAANLGCCVTVFGHDYLDVPGWRRLLDPVDFTRDLAEAIEDSLSLREKFRQAATTGLMLLRNPLGRRRQVGGRDWAERRLFHQVRSASPNFVLLRQARRDLEQTSDAGSAEEWLREIVRLPIHCRWLGEASPFAQSWTQPTLSGMEPRSWTLNATGN